MAVSSLIMEVEDGALEEVLPKLGLIEGVNVFGVKENQIVTVVEGESLQSVNRVIKSLSDIPRVIGIFPVYAGDHA